MTKGKHLITGAYETTNFHCALHLKDAPIIILDEVTAGVDVNKESCIQDAIS